MKKNIFVAIVFAVLISALTFPLAFKITHYLPAFFSTDESFAVPWDSWRIKYSFENGLSFKHTDLIAYPYGIDLYGTGYLSYLWLGLFYFLSILTGPILTYNIQALGNLFLSGLFAYILVFYLSGNRLCAIFSGIIFMASPFQFARIWQHLGLTFSQWIPLVLLAAIKLKERGSKGNKILFFLSLLLLFSFDWSIIYITTIAVLCFFIYISSYNWRKKLPKPAEFFRPNLPYFKSALIIWSIVLVILSPQFFTAIRNRLQTLISASSSVFSIYRRPFEDLFSQSARPLSYFLPAPVHPVFGKFTEQFVGTQIYGESFTEHALYLGWLPLILSFAALRKWKRCRKSQTSLSKPQAENKEDFFIGFFIFLAVAAWLFSQPPWWKIGGMKIFMPSFFMYKIVPLFRAYCRFGIVVMLAVAVLAGFGLKFILDRFKSQKSRVIITGLFCGLVLFEFWNWPPYKVLDVSRAPEVYYWLKEQKGDFVIAEYPLDMAGVNELYKFYQIKHEKKIINGTFPGTQANKVARGIADLSDPNTAWALKRMGVRYALVHKEDYLKTELIQDRQELDKIPRNSGLRFIRSFSGQGCPQSEIMCLQKSGTIDVYEIAAGQNKPDEITAGLE